MRSCNRAGWPDGSSSFVLLRSLDILRQYLVEPVILSSFRSLLGILGATAPGFGLSAPLGGKMSTGYNATMRLWAILMALSVPSIVGLVAGIYPAALDPVVALRNE